MGLSGKLSNYTILIGGYEIQVKEKGGSSLCKHLGTT
jgi:hypothetical protein